MRLRTHTPLVLSCLSILLMLTAPPAGAQVFFSHDLPGVGLPFTAVAAAPDESDIFATTAATMCSPSWSQGTNSLIFDNLAHLGLLPGDNIDAYSVYNEVPDLDWTFWRFSVDKGSTGVSGTAVPVELPFNAADIFWTDGSGVNWLCLWEWQVGLAGDDDMDGLEDNPDAQMVFFSLAPGSPSLALIPATAGDILAVTPGAGAPPTVAFSHAAIGLDDGDDVDALTVARVPGLDIVIYFSVVRGASGVPGSAVAANAPLNGADIYYSPLDGNNYILLPAIKLGLRDDDELDAIDPDLDGGGGPPMKPDTVDCRYVITPNTGVVPFVTVHSVDLFNLYPAQGRQIAAHIDLTIASGAFFPNWKAGFTNIPGGGTFNSTFNTVIPALGAVIGNNTFQLFAEDVTPAPFNHPPYPPSGDTCTDTEIVTALP